MNFPWACSRCILCLKDEPPTQEHIIPQQIGGKLFVNFLCKDCNDRLGHLVEPRVKQDPAIRIAVEHLRPRLPNLAAAVLDGQPYIGQGKGGAIRGSFKGDTFRVVSARQKDGSVIQPTAEARKNIERTLRKQGNSEDVIASALARFDSEPANQPISIAPGLEVTKWQIDQLSPALDGPSVSEQVLLKIAYELAACHLGDLVYDDSAPLRELRAAVWSPSGAPSAFEIVNLPRFGGHLR